MVKYIMLIVGCVVVENLADLILPYGPMTKFVKSIIGVFIFSILLMPIIELLKNV